VRPEWVSLIAHLDGLSPAERERAFARGAQYLRDAGVFVRHYGEEKSPRDWPLSPVPVIQPASEWQAIWAGLAQRAELLETIVADLYGEPGWLGRGICPQV
jgi:uncharacterized circularly permuted ATP-grasp superfamily protein